MQPENKMQPKEYDGTSIKAGIVQDFEKEKVGLKDGGDIIGTCRNCEKPLFRISKIHEQSPTIQWGIHRVRLNEQRFKGNCPYCGGESWVVKGDGTLMYDGIDGETHIIDADMSDPLDENVNIINNGIILTTLEVNKYG